MCARYDQGLVLFILLHQIGTFLAAMACMSSIPTVQYVPSCPLTEADWVKAAERKMCSSVGQNCSAPDEFVYHCLVNSFFNATLEVCAPNWKMNGYCPEFNVPGKRIQQVLERDCTKFPDKCPRLFNSSEVYKYPTCIRLEYSYFQDTTKQAYDAPSRLSHNGWMVLSIILIVIAVLAVTFGIILVCFRKYRKREKCPSRKKACHPNSDENTELVPNISTKDESKPKGTKTPSISNAGIKNTSSKPEKKALHKDTGSSGPTHKTDTRRMEDGFIVAAINFGTTYSKYGYSFVSEESLVEPELFVKPSCILLNPDKKFLSFCDEEYLNLGSHGGFCVLDKVSKLVNYQKGSDVELSNRFVDIFKSLKEKISENVATKFQNKQITWWVLCVPLTWTKGAEDFLTDTAQQAGIAKNLQVVKEHQAVLSWFSSRGGQVKDGDSLFVDLGGGSTKVYRVNAGEEWKAFSDKPTVGGSSIWSAFQRCIQDLFTPEVYEALKEKCKKGHLNLYLDMCHAMFRNETDAETQLQRFSHFETLQEIFRRINNENDAPSLDFQTIKESLLKQLKEEIKECIENAVKEFPHSGTVYVFGGASKSDILYQYVESLLGGKKNIKVNRIPYPNMAIIGGSIIERINMWSGRWERSKIK